MSDERLGSSGNAVLSNTTSSLQSPVTSKCPDPTLTGQPFKKVRLDKPSWSSSTEVISLASEPSSSHSLNICGANTSKLDVSRTNPDTEESSVPWTVFPPSSNSADNSSESSAVECHKGHRGLPQLVSRPATKVISKKSSVLYNRDARGTTSSVAITRDLLHQRPNSLIRGDGIKPEFEAFSRAELLRVTEDVCVTCGDHVHLYILVTCAHLLCRKCLIQQTLSHVKCTKCQTLTSRSQIRKHHATSVFVR